MPCVEVCIGGDFLVEWLLEGILACVEIVCEDTCLCHLRLVVVVSVVVIFGCRIVFCKSSCVGDVGQCW